MEFYSSIVEFIEQHPKTVDVLYALGAAAVGGCAILWKQLRTKEPQKKVFEQEPATEQAPTAERSPIAEQPARQEREFVGPNVTLDYLMDLYKTRQMTVESERLVRPYIGKWMTFSAAVDDARVGGNTYSLPMVVFELEHDEKSVLGRRAIPFFDRRYRGRVETLMKGEIINVRGYIDSMSINYIQFDHCGIVDN
ncbi:MAG TPA: hypothetical protein VHL31_11460 [Geminicoccus sp.]|jgi:hypothetical protein|uniref:hypothetical protein n=1 Tax=Geminicoccus sp. TaxID=2024832 RepID=UPI002E346C76|nr:hypothetical protein [Geminicoccus sp.]HEX2526896.1 hypothetical protein [Geminicoccus sp.]